MQNILAILNRTSPIYINRWRKETNQFYFHSFQLRDIVGYYYFIFQVNRYCNKIICRFNTTLSDNAKRPCTAYMLLAVLIIHCIKVVRWELFSEN